jgi:hypothetical protein
MVGDDLYVHGGEVSPGVASSDLAKIDLSEVLQVFNTRSLVTSCLRFNVAAKKLPLLRWDASMHQCTTMTGPVLQHAVGLVSSGPASLLLFHGGMRSMSSLPSDPAQARFLMLLPCSPV